MSTQAPLQLTGVPPEHGALPGIEALLLQVVIDSTTDGVLAVDADGKVVCPRFKSSR
jgi:hypothetical protein